MTVFRWIIYGLLALDAAGIAWLLLQDGGREAEVWFFFLQLPMLLIVLALVYLVLRAVLKG
ncbi:MAG TPA: hypothetical protein VGB65_02080 [Allosphingosinicella sp.]